MGKHADGAIDSPQNCGTVTPPSTSPTRQRIWRFMLSMIALILIGTVFRPIYLEIDARRHGPYTRWYNHRCQQLFDHATLLGHPAAELRPILGPERFYSEWIDFDGSILQAYDYTPSVGHSGKFRVLCQEGRIRSTQMFAE